MNTEAYDEFNVRDPSYSIFKRGTTIVAVEIIGIDSVSFVWINSVDENATIGKYYYAIS